MAFFCVIYLIVNNLNDLSAYMSPAGFYIPTTLNLGGKIMDISSPVVMGILNINADSFYKHSSALSPELILAKAAQMIQEGVDILDLGAMSTRPGAKEISIREEIDRLNIACDAIRALYPHILISIDTYRVEVLQAMQQYGINLINDISGGNDEMYAWAAQNHLPYILMHMKGTPETMSANNQYDDIIKEMLDYFIHRILQLHSAGVKDVIVDPGFGFAKNINQNYFLLNHLSVFKILEKPLMVGLSRKSMIWKTLSTTPEDALIGTAALHLQALQNGARILRVHDVKEAKQIIEIFNKSESNK